MDPARIRKPLLPGRGVLLFDEFCRATGLDSAVVEELMRTKWHARALWVGADPVRPFGLFDDDLPSRDELVSTGLSVRDDYDPAAHRSQTISDDASEEEAPNS